ncbi:MAG: hypothetical protein AB1757_07650 [Acidobacteriota bacterium]
MNRMCVTALMMAMAIGLLMSVNLSASMSLADDKAMEKAYSAAAQVAKDRPKDRGCETIPFPFQRDCKNLVSEKNRLCHNGMVRKCDDQTIPLAQARIKKDKEKIKEIRGICEQRLTNAENCNQIRNTVQGIFDAAQERVEKEKGIFESKLSKTKEAAMQAFYRRMIDYAETILTYYSDTKTGHEDQITQNLRLLDKCKKVIADADKPLR